MKWHLWILALICCAPASAQPVFFDSFDGNTLGEHWGLDQKFGRMEYNVSNSMLNVTRIFEGSIPGPVYSTGIVKSLSAMTDFHIRAVMGWDPGITQGIFVSMLSPNGTLANPLASVGFTRSGGGLGTIAVSLNSGAVGTSRPAPPPGLYEFSISRIGSTFSASFNGELLLESQDTEMRPAHGVHFRFRGPDSPEFAPLHVDLVAVNIPNPGVCYGILLGTVLSAGRRRP